LRPLSLSLSLARAPLLALATLGTAATMARMSTLVAAVLTPDLDQLRLCRSLGRDGCFLLASCWLLALRRFLALRRLSVF
jgi:hypothetical protein